MELQNLRCEYRRDPEGIDCLSPRLSWTVEAEQRSQLQTAWRILVASSPEQLQRGQGDLWDSGKVASGQTSQIEYAGRPLQSRDRCYWQIMAWDGQDRPSGWSPAAVWTMGLLQADDWQARWIGLDSQPGDDTELAEGTVAAPRYLRRAFAAAPGTIARATVYAAALGVYELRLNGSKVGDQVLAPEWTNYHKRIQYQVYDVTGQLSAGENVLGAELGNGWYSGLWQCWPPRVHIYGEQPWFLLQLEIDYLDGSRQTVISDGTWQGSTAGPNRYSGIYEGETYDARLEMPGWDQAGFVGRDFRSVQEGAPRAGPLVWQRSEPIRVTRRLQPVQLSEPRPGVYVFDMGQNMVGWCRLRVSADAGVTITMRHNEVLNPDGTVYMDNLHAGHLGRGDRQIVRYTCKGGGAETYEPHFTYLGFRYIEVAGLTARPGLDLLEGCVFHTSFQQTGTFTCSNPLLNRLVENIQWSQRGNMMGVPTDCPQRDERCGYTGDGQVFMPTMVFNFDVAAFFNKWLVDVCQDSLRAPGYFTDHAPDYGMGGSNVGWQDAGIICPYLQYRTYGDTRAIRDHYAAMKVFLAYLQDTANPDYTREASPGNGDHLNLGGGAASDVIATAYYYHAFHLMAEMAGVIGEAEDAAAFASHAGKILAAFANQFLSPDGAIKNSSQAGYALSFSMGLVPDELAGPMTERFVQEIEKFDWHPTAGILGASRLLPALHLAGRDDVAYRLLQQESCPSWLYQVSVGATTIWERWDGWTPEKGFQDSGMNSFNHYAFGAVGEYIFSMVGGIQPLQPGYAAIQIRPVIEEGLSWASASYDSIRGRIAVSWQKEASGIQLDVAIPANTVAEVWIPAARANQVSESGRPASQAEGVALLALHDQAAVYRVGSGEYHFTVKPPDRDR